MTEMAQNLLVDPKEFFRERVATASSTLKVFLGDELEFYVVNLLCDFINPAKLNESVGELDVLETPLAFMLQKAVETPIEEQRLRILKGLGDTSLYFAGYFQDYFNRKTFDISYYINMGSGAYSRLAKISKKRNDTYQSGVYTNLSENFNKVVDVVAEVSIPIANQSNQNILAIYDRWNRYNSTRLRKILENMGIDPIPSPMKTAQ